MKDPVRVLQRLGELGRAVSGDDDRTILGKHEWFGPGRLGYYHTLTVGDLRACGELAARLEPLVDELRQLRMKCIAAQLLTTSLEKAERLRVIGNDLETLILRFAASDEEGEVESDEGGDDESSL